MVFHNRAPVSAQRRCCNRRNSLAWSLGAFHSRHAVDAGGVPRGVLVRPAVPQVLVPAEPVDRLAAHAAESRPAREGLFAIGRGRAAEARRQIAFAAFLEPPGPAVRRAAAPRERTRQTVGTQRMRAPVAVDRKPRHRRRPAPVERIGQHGRGKISGSALVRRASARSFCSARVSDIFMRRNPANQAGIMPQRRKAFLSCGPHMDGAPG